MKGREEQELVARLNLCGWIIFLALGAASFMSLPLATSLGVILGGLLVTANLALLHRFVNRALVPGTRVKIRSVLFKYYLCFLGTLALIVVVMVGDLADELGLLIGLSVFAVNLF
ncbi:MAG: ATP synthase subunit I, partial [Thermodesulfobacteriota bacterium]